MERKNWLIMSLVYDLLLDETPRASVFCTWSGHSINQQLVGSMDSHCWALHE